MAEINSLEKLIFGAGGALLFAGAVANTCYLVGNVFDDYKDNKISLNYEESRRIDSMGDAGSIFTTLGIFAIAYGGHSIRKREIKNSVQESRKTT